MHFPKDISEEQMESASLDADVCGFLRSPWESLPAHAPPISPHLKLGEIVGKYQIQHYVAEGGTSHVFRARQLEPIHRDVALKVLKHLPSSKSGPPASWTRELETLANLSLDRVAPLLDVGRTQQGDWYLVFPWIDGIPIHAFAKEGHLTWNQVIQLIANVAETMQSLHDQGVYHGDLKPQNILVRSNGEPVITDFGCAKSQSHMDCASSLAFGGTLGFASPERLVNHHALDASQDVYSLGATLYYLLTGHPPVETDRPIAAIYQLLQNDIPAPSHWDAAIPRELDSICGKCMHRVPAQRYASMKEMSEDLKRYVQGRLPAAHSASTWRRMRYWVRQNRKRLTASGLCGLLILSVAAMAYKEHRQQMVRWGQKASSLLLLARSSAHSSLQAPQRVENLPETLDTRIQGYRSAIENFERLLASQDEIDIRMKLATSHFLLAQAFHEGRHWEQAIASYRHAIAILKAIDAPGLHRESHQFDLFHCHRGLFWSLLANKDSEAADRALDVATTTIEDLQSQQPENVDYLDALAANRLDRTRRLVDAEKWESAEVMAASAYEVACRLAVPASVEVRLLRQQAIGASYLAQICRKLHRADKAFDWNSIACEVSDRIAEAVPDVIEYQMESLMAHSVRAELMQETKKNQEADSEEKFVMSHLTRLRNRYPTSAIVRVQGSEIEAIFSRMRILMKSSEGI
jgi:serine/threonine protein kinase